VSKSINHSRVLKWYPHAWRDRYGDELVAFLQDRYGDRRVSLPARFSIIRSGTIERLRAGGIVGTSVNSDRSIQGSSLLVLCAWGMFVVVGTVFAKYTEHWPMSTPRIDQRLPSVAIGAVQVAAALGAVIIGIAGLLCLPAFATLVRAGGWRSIWTTARAAIIAGTVAGVASIVVLVWNYRLTPSQNITPPWELKAVGAAGGLLLVGALAIGAGTIIALVYRLQLSHHATRILGTLAVTMAGLMAVIFAGTLTWWITTAVHAPWFFGSLAPGASGSPAPPVMIGLASVMMVGLVLAALGSARIVDSLSRPRIAPRLTSRTE
jgi:MFS family permease